MEHFDLHIVADKTGWKVASRDGADGPYASLDEALDVARQAARVLNAAGHTTDIQVRDAAEPALASD